MILFVLWATFSSPLSWFLNCLKNPSRNINRDAATSVWPGVTPGPEAGPAVLTAGLVGRDLLRAPLHLPKHSPQPPAGKSHLQESYPGDSGLGLASPSGCSRGGVHIRGDPPPKVGVSACHPPPSPGLPAVSYPLSLGETGVGVGAVVKNGRLHRCPWKWLS